MSDHEPPSEDLLEQLKREIETGVDGHAATTLDDEALDVLSAAVGRGAALAEVAQVAERLMTGGEALDPRIRARFVQAADRGVAGRQADRAPLQLVLQRRRQELGIGPGDVAQRAGIPPESINHLESGQTPLTEVEPEALVKWADVVDLTKDQVRAGLQQSLVLAAGLRTYAGAHEATLPTELIEYRDRVLRLLEDG